MRRPAAIVGHGLCFSMGSPPRAHRRIVRVAITLACAALCIGETAFAQRIVVVTSGDGAPYRQALAAIEKLGVPVQALHVAADADSARLAAALAGAHDTAIVTLGTEAGELGLRHSTGRPMVNCMMIGNDDGNATAKTVPRLVPIDAQLAWLKRLLPNARNVGIAFDPAQNERRAAGAAAALQAAGYVPVLEPVDGSRALPGALNRLGNRVDVLLALPDKTVYAREHSRAILLFSFRHRIPVVGPTEGWVSAGALYAVDWDYTDLGRYCGALALRELGGSKAAMPPPPRTRIVANARSAEQLHLPWDAETLRSMDKVYE